MPTKYLHLDDTAIHYVHAGATTLPHVPPPLRRGAALLFVHGEGGSASLWSRQIAHFGEKHSPIAIDLPAHGRSSSLDGPQSAASAASLIDSFLAAVQAPPAVLVGHGLGGHIALLVAARRPERVRAVVTIGTAPRAAIASDAIEKLVLVVKGRLGQQFDTPFFGAAPDFAIMREFWGEMVKTDPKVRLSDLVAYRDSDVRSLLPGLARPVLVLQGDADRLCPVAHAEELVAATPGARLSIIAGAGHVAHLEQADEVNRAIESFLDAL